MLRGDQSVPLWRLRAVARMPRVVAVAALGALALGGVKTIFAATPTAPPAPAARSFGTAAVAGFAEAFARAYLTVDPARPERRERTVASFVREGEAVQLEAPADERVAVRWTAVAGVAAQPGRRAVVTVAADTSLGLLHLAVTVDRDASGALSVAASPALVGPPITARDAGPRVEREVDDESLRAVAGRVIKNYLARERDDLAADLAPGAVVSLPDLRLRVASVDGVTWSGRRVAVAVSARGRAGLRMALRYELVVVRRGGRWLVRTVHTNPAAMGGS